MIVTEGAGKNKRGGVTWVANCGFRTSDFGFSFGYANCKNKEIIQDKPQANSQFAIRNPKFSSFCRGAVLLLGSVEQRIVDQPRFANISGHSD